MKSAIWADGSAREAECVTTRQQWSRGCRWGEHLLIEKFFQLSAGAASVQLESELAREWETAEGLLVLNDPIGFILRHTVNHKTEITDQPGRLLRLFMQWCLSETYVLGWFMSHKDFSPFLLSHVTDTTFNSPPYKEWLKTHILLKILLSPHFKYDMFFYRLWKLSWHSVSSGQTQCCMVVKIKKKKKTLFLADIWEKIFHRTPSKYWK